MILAILGGAIAFAWTPVEPAPATQAQSEAALS